MLSIQTSSAPPGEGPSIVPEDLGKQAAEMLLEEIYRVSDNQHLADLQKVPVKITYYNSQIFKDLSYWDLAEN